MTKSTDAEQVRRVNLTLNLLQKKTSGGEVLDAIVGRYGVSRRQAYRYMQLAQQTATPQPVPEIKAAFTVKLPSSLIQQVRRRARAEKRSISDWVSQVLEQSLDLAPGHG